MEEFWLFSYWNLVINRGLANVEIVISGEDQWASFFTKWRHWHFLNNTLTGGLPKKWGVSVKFVVVPLRQSVCTWLQIGELTCLWMLTKQASTKKLFILVRSHYCKLSDELYYPSMNKDLHLDSIYWCSRCLIIAVMNRLRYGEQYDKVCSRLKEIRVSNKGKIISLLLKKLESMWLLCLMM